MANFINSTILSAFAESTIGSKVTRKEEFFAALTAALDIYDTAGDRVPGQHFVKMPEAARGTVSAGVGPRSANPEDYVLRAHRGEVAPYLRRGLAAEAESLAVVVYTATAYLGDPDVAKDVAEAERVRASGATHVVVAVLASAGPRAPFGAGRFVANLSGGNKEALLWSADEIRTKAKEVTDYWKEWSVVAD